MEQARRFKRVLDEATNADTGKPLAKATIVVRLRALKAFFQRLAGQPGYRSKLTCADAEYSNPHSVRNTLAQLGERVCPNPEAFKAWSQNLGHEQVLTTFTSYGAVSHHRQAEIIAALRDHDANIGHIDSETLRIARALRQEGCSGRRVA